MAKQIGIVKFTGTMGNVTFYKTRQGYFSKQKNSVTKERIKTDKAYEGSRRAMSEFGHASSLSRIFRAAIRPMVYSFRKGYFPSRLTALFRNIIKTDKVNALGERKLLQGDLCLMKGLEIAEDQHLDTVLVKMPTVTVNKEALTVTFSFEGFTGNSLVKYPGGATHFSVKPGLVLMDENADKGADFISIRDSDVIYIPVEKGLEGAAEFKLTYRQEGEMALLCGLMGIFFYQEVNGEYKELPSGSAVRVLYAEKLYVDY